VEEIEQLLHQYRPVGAPPELRDRIFGRAPRNREKVWIPWLLPASAVAAAILLYAMAAATRRSIPLVPIDPVRQAWIDEIDRTLNGNTVALDAAVRAIELQTATTEP